MNTASSGTMFVASNNGVYTEIATTGSNLGINRGFATLIDSKATQNYGFQGIAQNAFLSGGSAPPCYNIGARGTALNVVTAEQASTNFGIIGVACGARINIGLYGSDKPSDIVTCTETGGEENWALYLIGDIEYSGSIIAPSDENLKQNIENIENASEILNQLSAKTYEFKTEEYDFLSLPEGTRYGLISQDVEAVLPSLVRNYTHPAMTNLENEPVSPEVEIKGLNYEQFIPLLIAGFNEQSDMAEAKSEEAEVLQNEVEVLQDQIENLQQQMASILAVVQALQTKTDNCCTCPTLDQIWDSTIDEHVPAGKSGGIKLMQNVPNPFDTYTRIDFTLPADASVVVLVSDVNGRPLHKLVDEQMNAGPQSITLNGSYLAPGMYFYTVYANGEMITKKMVKK